jgi:hypothetical protein
MTERSEGSERADPSTKPVAVVDREKYDSLVSERDFLLSAYLRRRVGGTILAFVFATTVAMAGFWGGFAVGQRTNEESFKTVCSQVVDQAMKKFERHRNTTTKNGRPSSDNTARR